MQIIFRSQYRHVRFLPKYWYIVEIHYKKMKNINVHMLASHFSHACKNKNSWNWPFFDCNYLEKPTSAHSSFCFFWLCVTLIDRLTSLNIDLQNNFFLIYLWSPKSVIMGEAIQVWIFFCFTWDCNASNQYFLAKAYVHGYIKHSFYH